MTQYEMGFAVGLMIGLLIGSVFFCFATWLVFRVAAKLGMYED